jgi:hypothetical protein
LHVFVHQYLQIHLKAAICSDDQICAHTSVVGNVAHWIGNDTIRTVVNLALAGPSARRFDKITRGCALKLAKDSDDD